MVRTFVLSCIALLLVAACTAQPVRDVSELPVSIPEEGPRIAENQPTLPAAQAPARPAPTVIATAPRIDELYPARTVADEDRGTRPRRPPEGDITLNFENADVREVARVILGDLLRLNYVVDPNVAGTVTLSTGRALRQEDLLSVLGAVLASQNIRLLDYGGVFRLTRDAGPGALADGGIGYGSGTAYRVFPLQYIAAQQLQGILAPLLPEGAVVAVDPARNLIVVAGDPAVLRLAAGTIDIFDVDRMATQTAAIISLQQADAAIVATELSNIFAATGTLASQSGEPGVLQIIPIERLNGILIVGQSQDVVENAREWVFRLDRARDPTERRVFVYYVQHGGAERIATALSEILTAQPAAADPAAEGAPDTAATPAGLLDENLRISVDNENNALLISTTSENFRVIEDVLRRLDIQPLQVMIETSIFEVTLRDQLRFGVQFALSTGGLGIGEDGTTSFSSGTQTETGPGSIVTPIITPILANAGIDAIGGFNFTIEGSSATRLIIDALSDITEVNMISSPNVIVLNNNTAQLNVGDVVPIITQTTTSTVTANPLIVNTVQYRPTGVSLEVTPQASASGMVTLQLSQSVSDVRVTTSSTIDSPTIQNRSLISTVSVRSGDTVLLGGLIRESAADGRTGIPLLNELPIVGPLFGRRSETTQRTELVILIRPVIISSPEEASTVTQSMRNKFLTLVRQEREGIRQPRRIVDGDE